VASYDPFIWTETYEGQTQLFRFARVGGGSGPVTISGHTQNGTATSSTATSGSDYDGDPFSVTIPECEPLSDYVQLPLSYDDQTEGNEGYSLIIDSIDGGQWFSGDPPPIEAGQLSIDDNLFDAVDDQVTLSGARRVPIHVLANDIGPADNSFHPGEPQFHLLVDSFTQPDRKRG
jgi:hypothetical protein